MRKKEEILVHLEIFCFEHSGRFIVPPNCFAPYGYELQYLERSKLAQNIWRK